MQVLLNIFADEIHRAHQRCSLEGESCDPTIHKMELVFEAGAASMKLLKGAYSCISMVAGVGLVAFRDPFGIRWNPLSPLFSFPPTLAPKHTYTLPACMLQFSKQNLLGQSGVSTHPSLRGTSHPVHRPYTQLTGQPPIAIEPACHAQCSGMTPSVSLLPSTSASPVTIWADQEPFSPERDITASHPFITELDVKLVSPNLFRQPQNLSFH